MAVSGSDHHVAVWFQTTWPHQLVRGIGRRDFTNHSFYSGFRKFASGDPDLSPGRAPSGVFFNFLIHPAPIFVFLSVPNNSLT